MGVDKRPLSKDQASKIQKVLGNKEISGDEKLHQFRLLCVEAMQELNSYQSAHRTSQTKLDSLNDEYEKLSKKKDKLGDLCRELQLQLKKNISDREEERKAQTQRSLDIQGRIEEINSAIETSSEEKISQMKARLDVEEKLVELSKRLEMTEEHQAKQLEAKEIELKLVAAKSDHELHLLKMQMSALSVNTETQGKLLSENAALKEGLGSYKEQFDKLVATMKKSEGIYASCKDEISSINQKRGQVEKENRELTSRVNSLLGKFITQEQTAAAMTQQLATKSAQVDKLKELCQSLKARLDQAT